MHHLCRVVQPSLYLPNEYIVHKGDVAQRMYFIQRGAVSCGTTTLNIAHKINSGHCTCTLETIAFIVCGL